MQRTPPLLEQTTVGHLVRQGVLEGVGTFWKEAGRIEEFHRLEVRQAPVQHRLGHLGNGLQEGHGDLRLRRRGARGWEGRRGTRPDQHAAVLSPGNL